MGDVIENKRWTRPGAYMPKTRGARVSRWGFPLLMVAVPLGAFSAVFFAPSLGGMIGSGQDPN